MLPQPAFGQSLFESIFGFLGPAKPAKRAPAPAPHEFKRTPPPDQRRVNAFSERVSSPVRRGGRKYRTVCVRICDGYYFPISYSVKRNQFYEDANACNARCDSEARLFYMPKSGSIEKAYDLEGMAYSKLKTAFLYRKTLKEGCSCRPKPWSVAERARHKQYAFDEKKFEVASNEATEEVAAGELEAGTESEAETVETVKAAVAPMPVRRRSTRTKPKYRYEQVVRPRRTRAKAKWRASKVSGGSGGRRWPGD